MNMLFLSNMNFLLQACITANIDYKYVLKARKEGEHMASDFFKSNVVTGLAAGIGATLLAPVLLPMLARIAKPLTKSVIKTGMTVYEKGRESFAELSETVDDLVAEAKVELESEAVPAAAAGSAAATAQPSPNEPAPAPSPTAKPSEPAPDEAKKGAPGAQGA
jgi:hypothetical protein